MIYFHMRVLGNTRFQLISDIPYSLFDQFCLFTEMRIFAKTSFFTTSNFDIFIKNKQYLCLLFFHFSLFFLKLQVSVSEQNYLAQPKFLAKFFRSFVHQPFLQLFLLQLFNLLTKYFGKPN